MRTLKIAVIGGDGIGPEVVAAATPAIEKAAAGEGGGATIAWEPLPYGADHFLKTGETLPDAAFRHLRDDVDALAVEPVTVIEPGLPLGPDFFQQLLFDPAPGRLDVGVDHRQRGLGQPVPLARHGDPAADGE